MFRKPKFALSTALLVVIVYAVTFALGDAVSLSTDQLLAAVVVVSVFVAADFWMYDGRTAPSAKLTRASIFVAHYATAYAFAAFACLTVFCFTIESRYQAIVAAIEHPRPPVSGLLDRLGDAIAAPLGALATLIMVILLHVFVMSFFSLLGFLASIFVIRRADRAKSYAILNIPGTAVFGWLLAMAIFTAFNEESAQTAPKANLATATASPNGVVLLSQFPHHSVRVSATV